jgi:hypothetical protein
MDQVLIDVIQTKFLQREIKCCLGILDFSAADFGCDIELISWDPSLFDGFAELCFISID